MNEILENKETAHRYLFGELSEPELAEFEERLFTDENLSLFLDEAENDLVDEYLRHELPAIQRQKFEKFFLNTERGREKVRAAQILESNLFAHPETVFESKSEITLWERIAAFFRLPNLALAGGLAAVLLMFLFTVFWLTRPSGILEQAGIGNQNQPVPTVSPQITPEENKDLPNNNIVNPQTIPSPIQKNASNKNTGRPDKQIPQSPKQPPKVFAFTLLPPVRSSERPVLQIPRGVQTIQLRVVHNNTENFINYRVEIRASDGDLIWSREFPVNPKTLEKPLFLSIRSGALAPGAYELSISGSTAGGQLEEINFYNFSVEKK